MPPGREASLFVVSPHHAVEVGEVCAACGWAAMIVARVADAGAAFTLADTPVAVIDARGSLAGVVDLVRDLAEVIERRDGILLVLLEGGDAAATERVCDAGAMQVMAGPLSRRELTVALRLALRASRRLAAARTAGIVTPAASIADAAHARNWVETLAMVDDAPDPAAIVLQLAIGRFGQLNAAYGRSVADATLRAVEQRLRSVAETMTFAGAANGRHWATRVLTRLAGAEFALVLAPPTTLADASALGRHIAGAFDVPFVIDGHSIHLGCRIGIAGVGPARGPAAALIAERAFRHASVALETARSRPPGAVEVFEPASGADPTRRMADLEADLRVALDAGEVDILFQPQVDIDSGWITGAEALVRWHHPVFGQLSAETLLEVADSAEFATRLGSYIQRRALTVASAWPGAIAGLGLAVNVTARDLALPEFLAGLDAALASSGFPPRRLTIELTESDLIEHLDATADVLSAIRARGIEVALDDFGTGYSSLAYLKALPLDCLKIDRRLVADLAGSSRDRVVVKGVVDMAHMLGMRVVAEGIESEDQRARVAAAGCDGYQGFFCAVPMTAAALAEFVPNWNARAAAI